MITRYFCYPNYLKFFNKANLNLFNSDIHTDKKGNSAKTIKTVTRLKQYRLFKTVILNISSLVKFLSDNSLGNDPVQFTL